MSATKASSRTSRPGAGAAKAAPRRPFSDLERFLPLLLLAVTGAAAALYLEAEHRIAGRWGFSLDDSWIYAQMARNLATGRGFAFNPGEPVAGSTGPLYTFILAFFYLLFHEVVWSAKIFGLACLAGSAYAIHRAVRALVPERAGVALFAGLLVATAPALLWGALSGMEIALYLLLVSFGIDAYARGRWNLATFLWSAGVWVRPDGLFLAGLAVVLGPPREIWKRALCAAPPIVAFLAFNHAIGGHWMPQTVGVKAHFGMVATRTVTMLREWGALWGIPYRSLDELEEPVLLLALLAIGGALLLRKRPILALYTLGFPIALSLFYAGSGSHKRYILYVIPFGIAMASVGLAAVAARFRRATGRRAVATIAVVCLAWQLVLARGEAETHGWNVQNINEMQRTMGEFARRITKPGDRIAANDIGAIGYFSERPVVDLVGLITPREPLPRMLSRYRPELMIVFVDWFHEYALWDPESRGFVFLDADSTHKYMMVGALELRHNTISSKDQMLAFRRLPMDAPAPERLLMEVR